MNSISFVDSDSGSSSESESDAENPRLSQTKIMTPGKVQDMFISVV